MKSKQNNFFISPFITLPHMDNYSPHDNETAVTQFPYCCDFHKELYHYLDKCFREEYKNYSTLEKEIFKGYLTSEDKSLANKIIRQVSYTEFFIKKNINEKDWFEKIRYYIDYNICSFGIPSLGVFHYLVLISSSLKYDVKSFVQKKTKKLIETLEQCENLLINPDVEIQNPDVIQIRKVLKKWTELFPFNLEEFNPYKNDFENVWNIFQITGEVNPYTGFPYYETISSTRLYSFLLDKTQNLLKFIDSSILIDLGFPSTALSNYNLGIIREKHKLKQLKLLDKHTDEELNYILVLEQWFENEKDFLDELRSLNPDKHLNRKKQPFKTFTTDFTTKGLETLRVHLISEEYISDILNSDFLYLFRQESIIPGMRKIEWLCSKSKCHYFLSKMIFRGKTFDFTLANSCIKFQDGTMLDSNSKGGEYLEIDHILDKCKDLK